MDADKLDMFEAISRHRIEVVIARRSYFDRHGNPYIPQNCSFWIGLDCFVTPCCFSMTA
jgi:hypothetical protein